MGNIPQLGDQFPVIDGKTMGFIQEKNSKFKQGDIMPITNREARNIKDIVNSYITEYNARQMFTELVSEVADTTDNDSVKQSILMLNSLYQKKNSETVRPTSEKNENP